MTQRTRTAGKANVAATIYTNVDGDVTGDEVAASDVDLWDSAIIPEAWADLASATTCNIGAQASNFLNILGITTITAFDLSGAGAAAGIWRQLKFAGILTLTHNATSLIIPGAANITTAAGDVATVISEGSGNWRVLSYVKASGKALRASALSELTTLGALLFVDWTDIASSGTTDIGPVASNFIRVTGATTINALGTTTAGVFRFLRFASALTLTYNATSLILPGSVDIATLADDVCLVKSEGSGNWRVLGYWRRSGAPLGAGLAAAPFGPFTLKASATTTDLNNAVPTIGVSLTGTATVTSFGSGANLLRIVKVVSTPTLTHNATSLILPGGVDIVCAAGDRFIAMSDASANWTVISYVRATGKPITANSLDEINPAGPLGLANWIDVVSATTTDLGAVASNFIRITGTTPITGLGTIGTTVWRFVRFASALTLTYNATSLILPGSANITTAADDCALFKSEGTGNWRCLAYWKRDGTPVVASTVTAAGLAASPFGPFTTIASATTTDLSTVATVGVSISGTTTITSFGTGASLLRIGKFANVLILTHNATSLILPGAANITTAAGDRFIALSDGSGNWTVVNYTKASGKAVIGPAAADITDSSATGRSALTAASAAALATVAGVGTGDSPTFTAVTLSNGQIIFPATDVPSANANTLDDYEEGTWTPTVTFATPGTSSMAYGTHTGNYTKIGQLALLRCDLTFTPTIGTGSGNILITGNPFTPSNSNGWGGAVTHITSAFTWPSSRTTVSVYISSGDFLIACHGSAVTTSIMAASNLTGGSSHTIRFPIFYEV